MKMLKRGLYAVTPLEPDTHVLCQKVEAALQGGAVLLQYRAKGLDEVSCETQARELQSLCQQYGVPFLLNDNVALATRINADGVHLGKDDMSLVEARALLGGDKLIGVSCYASVDLATKAQAQGADYVAFGAVFASATKPNAARVPLDVIRQAKQVLRCPVVAIGGITPDNAAQVCDAGADLLAVVGGVFAAQDVKKAAQLLGGCWQGV